MRQGDISQFWGVKGQNRLRTDTQRALVRSWGNTKRREGNKQLCRSPRRSQSQSKRLKSEKYRGVARWKKIEISTKYDLMKKKTVMQKQRGGDGIKPSLYKYFWVGGKIDEVTEHSLCNMKGITRVLLQGPRNTSWRWRGVYGASVLAVKKCGGKDQK